jgi:hypothetical protein
VTDQYSQDAPARLEILPTERYARARPYVDDTALVDLESAKIVVARSGETPPDAASEPPASITSEPAQEIEEGPQDSAPRYPLRRRADNIRDAKHSAYDDAASPGEGLDIAYNYVRAALTCSSKRGMHHQSTEDALVDMARALMAVGNAHTDAMRVWRPEP